MPGTVNEMMETNGGGGPLRKRTRVEQGTNVPSRGRCTRMARRTVISTIIASFLSLSVRFPLTFHLIIFHRSPANFSLITFLPYDLSSQRYRSITSLFLSLSVKYVKRTRAEEWRKFENSFPPRYRTSLEFA